MARNIFQLEGSQQREVKHLFIKKEKKQGNVSKTLAIPPDNFLIEIGN